MNTMPLTTHYQAIVSAPGFSIGIRCHADALHGIDFLPAQAELKAQAALAQEAVRQLSAYLRDPQSSFHLPLAPAGTPFQSRVWAQISAIPCGQLRSYGELAKILSSGPRAVGGACGANPYPLIVPCHRVVASNGGIGGFANTRGGLLLDIKRWLVQHERI